MNENIIEISKKNEVAFAIEQNETLEFKI